MNQSEARATVDSTHRYAGFPSDYPTDGSMDYGTYPLHAGYMRLYRRGLQAARMPDNDWRRPRFFQLIEMLKLTTGLQGATAEAGCFRGLASHMICWTIRETIADYQGQTHFMIDSFEGLSPPVDEDGQFGKSRFNAGAFTKTSVTHVEETMREFPETKIFKGWIPSVFKWLPDQQYRFVHIDVDIYQPTLDCLEYFYRRIVCGGMIVIDDYGPWPRGNWPGCGEAVRKFSRDHSVPFAALDTGNAVIFKR